LTPRPHAAIFKKESEGTGGGMHEVGVMESALGIALKRAADEGAGRIHQLTMRVGPLSGVVPEALEFAFDVLARGTIAEGATLEVERVPILCYCRTCRREFQPEDLFCECPGCHTPSGEVRRGRELELASLEVS
jgi:hydrogenase nickel incorporation protein HypA/HybF